MHKREIGITPFDCPRDNVWRYWQAALAAALPSEAYPGFGLYAQITLLEQEDWLNLTEQTLARTDGGLDWTDGVARRAAKSSHDPRALHTVTALLRRPSDPWDTALLVEVGHDLLINSLNRSEITPPGPRFGLCWSNVVTTRHAT
jgi:hypothetical protein